MGTTKLDNLYIAASLLIIVAYLTYYLVLR